MFEIVDSVRQGAVIKVIGVGGGGGNAVNHMVNQGIEGVEFISVNTDAQALTNCNARTAIQIGSSITRGLGAGANPEQGKEAALEDRDRLQEVIEGSDMVFITAGMGGGTGTGAAPVVAQVARELGVLTVAVVTRPFPFEGRRRARIADQGIAELGKYCESLITIPNEKLLPVLGADIQLKEAFNAANRVLQGAVQGIAELITRPGLINVDFADVRTVMSVMGMAMMGTGEARGEHRAREAAEAAISSPLLEDIDLTGANGMLVNVTAGESLTMGEFDMVGQVVSDLVDEDATVVVGTAFDADLEDRIRVTVVATGIVVEEPPVVARQPKLEPVPARQPRMAEASGGGYRQFDTPPHTRRGGADPERGERADPQAHPETGFGKRLSDETLDIPAFLRRQAD
jgi:cell division protein FtsZ